MIKLKVSAANIAVEEKETLTEGRVGLLCRFSFTGEWDGLAKTAVFDGADSRDVILTEDTVAVPAECLAAEGYSLSVGVYGKNAAGDIVIPTVYATVGKIQRSAYPSGKETAAPTPDVVAQIQQAAANAEAMARSVREDADLGKFNGGQGPQGPAGATGPKGDTGAAGEAGGYYTPAVTQPDENTLRVAFTPSKEDMPAVADTDIPLSAGGNGLTAAQINALDGMFKVCAFIKADISAEYNEFCAAFDIEAATITGISATYSGGSVPAGTALDDLTGIVVTAQYSDGSTATVTGYTLSGEITEGSNTITVTYQDKTATFTVTGTAAAQVYTVTNNLTNVTNSNAQTEVTDGFYSATLTVAAGNVLNSITITMGGVDITDSVYGDGSILISEVTGDIVITAVAGKTILYQLSGTPKSVDGLSEDTGIAFGASDANGYVKALTICIAYTGFGPNETLMKMSSGRAVEITTNAGGSNTQIRVTSCSNAVTVNPEISDSGDYRVIITKEATSVKTLNIHTLSSGAVATIENVGTYGNFSHSVCAGNLIVGDSDITVNKLVIYEGILSDAHIATFLSGGEV